VITGGEPTLRADIEELAEAARFECKFRSLLMITNGNIAGSQAADSAGGDGAGC